MLNIFLRNFGVALESKLSYADDSKLPPLPRSLTIDVMTTSNDFFVTLLLVSVFFM